MTEVKQKSGLRTRLEVTNREGYFEAGSEVGRGVLFDGAVPWGIHMAALRLQ
jgi:hypothetical protein